MSSGSAAQTDQTRATLAGLAINENLATVPHAPTDPPTPARPAPAPAKSPRAGSSRRPSCPAEPISPPASAHLLLVQLQYSFSFSFHHLGGPCVVDGSSPCSTGSLTVNVDPSPCLLCTLIDPSCSVTIFLATANPN